MSTYLEIFGDVIRIATFQHHASHRLHHRKPALEFPVRPYRSLPDRAGGQDPVP